MTLLETARLVIQQVPEPTGPDAPADVVELVTKGLNFIWFTVLAGAFATASWGLGSLAWAAKKQQFGGVNEGKQLVALSLIGASGMTVLRSVFVFFGI
jgi:hypothetical protein